MAIRKEIYEVIDHGEYPVYGRTLHVRRLGSEWDMQMHDARGTLLTYWAGGFSTWQNAMNAFKRHRPNYELKFLKEVEE